MEQHTTSMLKEARNDFVRVVSETVTRLMHEHGYSRDRATSLLLREIAETPQDDDDGSKLTMMKQRYHLAQQQASRAWIVASALETLIQKYQNNRVDAIHQLTERISRATFSDTIPETTAAPPRKTVSGISLLEIPHTKQPQSQPQHSSTSSSVSNRNANNNNSPTKRTKLSSFSKTTKGKNRKRTIEEMGSHPAPTTDSNSLPAEDTTRARADSVAEAVSAKMNQPTTETTVKATRAKRSRSMEDEGANQNGGKRTRTLDA